MKKLGEILFRAVIGALARLPLGVHYALCECLAFLSEHVLRYRRKVVERNIENSFPELDAKGRRRIRHGFYRHFGEIIAETIWLGARHAGDKGFAQLMSVEGVDALTDAWNKAPSVLVMMSHAGNWELTGGMFDCCDSLPFSQKDVCEVYKRLSSPMWERFMTDNRTTPLKGTGFDKLVESRDILRFALRNRDRKIAYFFANDQFPYRGAAHCDVGEFLHQPTLAMTGGANLASKLHMAVLYLNMRRDRRGHYTYHFESICDDAADMDATGIMRAFYARLERDIKACPANYLWSHRRWKQNENNYIK